MIKTDYRLNEVFNLASQIENGNDDVHFKELFSNANSSVMLVAFKSGQFLAEHRAPADVMVYVAEGKVDFTLADTTHEMKKGDFMLMNEGTLHRVLAKTDATVMLAKMKP